MENKRSILITGASGFIGSHLTEEALNRGWDVWAAIRPTSSRTFLRNPNLKFIYLDNRDESSLKTQIFKHIREHGRWDYVIHNAGATRCARKEDFYRINTDHTVWLAKALKQEGATPDAFVFMSSLGVMGPGDASRMRPFSPDDTPRPDTDYGRSKLEAEKRLQEIEGFPCLILRPSGVYGPREKDYFTLMQAVQRGLSVSVGFKPQMLDFFYIDDLVQACFKALESGLHHKIWMLSDGNHYPSDEFTELVRETLGKKHLLKLSVPLPVLWLVSQLGGLYGKAMRKAVLFNPDKYRILKQRNWTVQIDAACNELDFRPETNLKEGLRKTTNWYRENGWL